MKKFYSFMLLTLLSLFGLSTANAATITLDIDDVNRVNVGELSPGMWSFMPDTETPFEGLANGLNFVETTKDNIYVKALSGSEITSVTVDGVEIDSWSKIPVVDGMTVVVTSSSVAPAATISLICDDYTKVAVQVVNTVSYDIRDVLLTANEQSVALYANETAVNITAKYDDQPLSKVLRNGTEVYGGGFGSVTYNIDPIADGDVIEVFANAAPAQMCAVSFTFSDDNARNYIEVVAAADVPVDNWADGFEVEAGTYIALNVNSSIENIKIYANDVEQEYNRLFGKYQFQITEPTVIRVESFVPEPDPTFTINVDNAEAVEVGYTKPSSSWWMPATTVYLSLTNGENTITMEGGSMNDLFVRAKSGFNLETITVDGSAVDNTESIPVTANMVLDITTSEVPVVLSHVTLKCDDYTRVSVGMGMTVYELTSNEQQLEFLPGEDAVFAISAADASQPLYSVKHNGNEVYGSGFGSSSKTYYIFNPQDGDLIEVQAIAPEVTKYPVSFLFNNDTARSYITEVAVDNVRIDNWADGFEAEEAAYVAVGVDTSMSNVTIKVNGVQKTPHVLFSNISFNVYEATVVEVTAEEQTDPEPVAITINVNVDDAARVKVGHTADEGDNDLTVVDGDNIITLPAGVNEIYVRPATNEATIKSVTVNDVEVADGGYENIPVADGDHIVVLSDKTDAIRAIMGGADSVEVYSINGVKVMSNADAQQVRNLAPGMYIINGKKVIKK